MGAADRPKTPAHRTPLARRQGHNAVSHDNGLIHIVGDQHHGLAFLVPDVQDFVLEVGACQRIESTQRFIQQENVRVSRQGAGNGDALPHTARQLRGAFRSRRGQTHQVNVTRDVRPTLRCRPAWVGLVDGQRHIVEDAQPGYQRIPLKDHAAVWSWSTNGFALLEDDAGIRRDQSGQERHERCLATARKANNGQELTGANLQSDVLENTSFPRANSIRLADPSELEHGSRWDHLLPRHVGCSPRDRGDLWAWRGHCVGASCLVDNA